MVDRLCVSESELDWLSDGVSEALCDAENVADWDSEWESE